MHIHIYIYMHAHISQIHTKHRCTSPGQKFRHTKVHLTFYGPTCTAERFKSRKSLLRGQRGGVIQYYPEISGGEPVLGVYRESGGLGFRVLGFRVASTLQNSLATCEVNFCSTDVCVYNAQSVHN